MCNIQHAVTASSVGAGGSVDPGEGVAEAASREFWEETGVRVQYTDQHYLFSIQSGYLMCHFFAKITEVCVYVCVRVYMCAHKCACTCTRSCVVL